MDLIPLPAPKPLVAPTRPIGHAPPLDKAPCPGAPQAPQARQASEREGRAGPGPDTGRPIHEADAGRQAAIAWGAGGSVVAPRAPRRSKSARRAQARTKPRKPAKRPSALCWSVGPRYKWRWPMVLQWPTIRAPATLTYLLTYLSTRRNCLREARAHCAAIPGHLAGSVEGGRGRTGFTQ